MIEDGAYLPSNFLTPFELDRLKMDRYGGMEDLNDDHRIMILGFLIISKILV